MGWGDGGASNGDGTAEVSGADGLPRGAMGDASNGGCGK